MKFTNLRKGATGLLVAAAFVGLSALPASAATVNVDLNAGDLNLYDMFGGPIASIDLSDPGAPCDPQPASTVTVVGDANEGTVDASINSYSAVNIGGTDYVAALSTTLSGEYTDSTSNYWADGSATAVLVRSTGEGSCVELPNAGPCTLEVGGLHVEGVISHSAPMDSLTVGDTATVDGASALFGIQVSGNATDCGVLIAADLGSAEIVGGILEVI